MGAFNDLDKVTERELVSDIVERLKLSKAIKINGTDKYVNEKLIGVITLIINALPSSVVLSNIGMRSITATALVGTKTVSANISGHFTSVARTTINKCGFDIANMVTLSYNSTTNVTTASVTFPGVFISDDAITFYLLP